MSGFQDGGFSPTVSETCQLFIMYIAMQQDLFVLLEIEVQGTLMCCVTAKLQRKMCVNVQKVKCCLEKYYLDILSS